MLKLLVMVFFFIGNQSYSMGKLGGILQKTKTYENKISSLKDMDGFGEILSDYYKELFNAINTNPNKKVSNVNTFVNTFPMNRMDLYVKDLKEKGIYPFSTAMYELSEKSNEKLIEVLGKVEKLIKKKKPKNIESILREEIFVKEELSKMILRASIDGTNTSNTIIGYLSSKKFTKKDTGDDKDRTLSAFLREKLIDKTQDELYREGLILIDPITSYMVLNGHLVLNILVARDQEALQYYESKREEILNKVMQIAFQMMNSSR